MAWYLAPTLVQLRLEVNEVHPNRSKKSDGAVGDTAHSARKSDHNPDYSAGGVVRATDTTNEGINVDALVTCAINDWRTAYVISRGLIYTRDNDFRPVKYTGSNGHYQHVHISIRHGSRYENSTDSWQYAIRAGVSPAPAPAPVEPPAPQIPEEVLPPIPKTPEEAENMGPYILVAPDSRWFFVVAGSPKPTAVQVGKDTAQHADKPLASLPIYRIKDAGTWDRLQRAYEWVNA